MLLPASTTDPVDRSQVMLVSFFNRATVCHRDAQTRTEERLFDVMSRERISGAGSTISNDVPDDTLAVARAKARHIDGWQRPTKKK